MISILEIPETPMVDNYWLVTVQGQCVITKMVSIAPPLFKFMTGTTKVRAVTELQLFSTRGRGLIEWHLQDTPSPLNGFQWSRFIDPTLRETVSKKLRMTRTGILTPNTGSIRETSSTLVEVGSRSRTQPFVNIRRRRFVCAFLFNVGLVSGAQVSRLWPLSRRLYNREGSGIGLRIDLFMLLDIG